MDLINEAIDSCDAEQLLKALQNPAAQLPPVFDYACALYFEEFHNMRDEKQLELDYEEICAAVRGKLHSSTEFFFSSQTAILDKKNMKIFILCF